MCKPNLTWKYYQSQNYILLFTLLIKYACTYEFYYDKSTTGLNRLSFCYNSLQLFNMVIETSSC